MMSKLIAAGVIAAALTGTAQAAINVEVFTDTGAAGNATLAQHAALGTPNGTTTVDAINFNAPNASTNYTVGTFLNSPSGLDATTFNHTLDNTYLYLTGQLYLNAGNNSFVVAHDDGLQLNIDGIGLVVDAPGPSSPSTLPFDVFASSAGLYNFELSYGEAFGAPAELIFTVNDQPVGGVPEPATWAMMLLGFGAIGYSMRRKRAAALHFA